MNRNIQKIKTLFVTLYNLPFKSLESVVNIKNISKCYCFCCLNQINAGLVSRRDLFEKHKNSYCSKTFDW